VEGAAWGWDAISVSPERGFWQRIQKCGEGNGERVRSGKIAAGGGRQGNWRRPGNQKSGEKNDFNKNNLISGIKDETCW
jgi:hypothetical protein